MLPSVGFIEMAVIGVIAVLLFGKRLPEIARSMGQGYQELRKGLMELQRSIDLESASTESSQPKRIENDDLVDDFVEPTAPKLELPSDTEDEAAQLARIVSQARTAYGARVRQSALLR